MRHLLRALLVLALLVPSVEAQLPTDSVEVTIYNLSDLNLVITPQGYRGFSGDTITFQAVAIDGPTGDTLDVDIVWSTDNPNAVDIDPQTGFATFNNRGRYNVYAEVTAIRTLQMAFFGQAGPDIGSTRWTEFTQSNPLRLTVGEQAQLCNYILVVESDGDGGSTSILPLSKSEALCPDMGGQPLPVVPVEWSSSDPSIVCFPDECAQQGPDLRQVLLDEAFEIYFQRRLRRPRSFTGS